MMKEEDDLTLGESSTEETERNFKYGRDNNRGKKKRILTKKVKRGLSSDDEDDLASLGENEEPYKSNLIEKSASEASDSESGSEQDEREDGLPIQSQESEDDLIEQQLREFEATQDDNISDTRSASKMAHTDYSRRSATKADTVAQSNISVFAHCPGRVSLDLSTAMENGPVLVSGGSDGSIRVFPLTNNPDSTFSKTFTTKSEITCVAAHPLNATVAYGEMSGEVTIRQLSDGPGQDLICRLSGPVRSLVFSFDAKILAIGTSEHLIKLVNVALPTEIRELAGHIGPILSLSSNPMKNLLASTSTDGYARVWDIDKAACLKTWENVLDKDKTDDLENPQVGKMDWSPCGSYLAHPGKPEIRVFMAAEWNRNPFKIIQTKFTSSCNVVAWSPDGKLIVASTVGMRGNNGELAVFRFDNGDSIFNGNVANNLPARFVAQSIKWLPNSYDIAMIVKDGDICVLRQVCAENLGIETAAEKIEAEAPNVTNPSSGKHSNNDIEAIIEPNENFVVERQREIVRYETQDHGDETIEDAPETAVSKVEVEKLLNDRIQRLEDSRPVRQVAFQPSSTAFQRDADDNRRYLAWNSIGCIVLRSEDSHNSIEVDFADGAHRSIRFTDPYGFSMGALSATGAIFATLGGSPSDNSKVDTASWHNDSEDWDPTMDIRGMASQSANKNLSLAELVEKAEKIELGLEQASTGDNDATKSISDADKYGEQSRIFFRPFAAWSSNSDWTICLPHKEKARCVAAGNSFVAVATSRRVLRIFRSSGLQEPPLILPGPVVSMVGMSSLLFVIYHRNEPNINGTQSLAFSLFNILSEESTDYTSAYRLSHKTIAQGFLPTPVRQVNPLKWMGFADKSMGLMPVYLDNKGNLMGLSRASDMSWILLSDIETFEQINPRKGEGFWPVSVSGKKIVGVVMRNFEQHPSIYPRPVLSGFDIDIPLLGLRETSGTLKYRLEEETTKKRLFQSQIAWANDWNLIKVSESNRLDDDTLRQEEALLDMNIIKQIALAVKLKRSARGFGLVKRLRLLKSIEIAIVQAKRYNADPGLIERMERYLEYRTDLEASSDESSDESNDEEPLRTKEDNIEPGSENDLKDHVLRSKNRLHSEATEEMEIADIKRKRVAVENLSSNQETVGKLVRDSQPVVDGSDEENQGTEPNSMVSSANNQPNFKNPFACKPSPQFSDNVTPLDTHSEPESSHSNENNKKRQKL